MSGSRPLVLACLLACAATLSAARGADPDKAATEGEVARAYADWALSQGDAAGARRELSDHLARFPEDQETRDALERVQRGETGSIYEERTGGRRLGLSASARTGFDTNVLLVSDSFLSAQAVSGQASPLVGADAAVSGASPASGGRLAYWGGASFNAYTGSKASRFNVLSGLAGVRRELEGLGALSLETSLLFLNQAGLGYYGFSASVGWERLAWSPPSGKLFAGARMRMQDFDDPVPALDRDGPAVGAYARLESALPAGQSLATSLELERAFTNGAELSALLVGLQGSWSMPLTPKDRLLSGLRIVRTDYVSSSQKRGDWLLLAAPGWSRAIAERSVATLTYALTLSRSNASAAQYAKHMVLVQVKHEIF